MFQFHQTDILQGLSGALVLHHMLWVASEKIWPHLLAIGDITAYSGRIRLNLQKVVFLLP